MPAQPEITSVTLSPNHPSPQWRFTVEARLPGGLVAPLASCRSPHRAAIVEEALRRLSEADPKVFAQLVRDAKVAEQQEDSESELKTGTWVLWVGRLMRIVNVGPYSEENLVGVLEPWAFDMRAKGETCDVDAAPRHELRVLTDEEGVRRRAAAESARRPR